jgi:hypothetical protein
MSASPPLTGGDRTFLKPVQSDAVDPELSAPGKLAKDRR